jgi:hypothetical protein
MPLGGACLQGAAALPRFRALPVLSARAGVGLANGALPSSLAAGAGGEGLGAAEGTAGAWRLLPCLLPPAGGRGLLPLLLAWKEKLCSTCTHPTAHRQRKVAPDSSSGAAVPAHVRLDRGPEIDRHARKHACCCPLTADRWRARLTALLTLNGLLSAMPSS